MIKFQNQESIVLEKEEWSNLYFDNNIENRILVFFYVNDDVVSHKENIDFLVDYENGRIKPTSNYSIGDYSHSGFYNVSKFNHENFSEYGNYNYMVYL